MDSDFTGPEYRLGRDGDDQPTREMVMEIAGKTLRIRHIPGPLGVRGRNSDNRRIREQLGWAPGRPLREGMARASRGSPNNSDEGAAERRNARGRPRRRAGWNRHGGRTGERQVFQVDLFEARPFPGGRATSWPVGGADGGTGEVVDNCQHVLLRWRSSRSLPAARSRRQDRVSPRVLFHRTGGKNIGSEARRLPCPAHFAESFLGLKFLNLTDKFAIGLAMNAIPKEIGSRRELDEISIWAWLREKEQTESAIERYWRQVLVSAVNEELHRMAASGKSSGWECWRATIRTKWDWRTNRRCGNSPDGRFF